MNNTVKSVIYSAVVAIIVVAVGFAIYHPSVKQTLVGGTSPEISSPYLVVNGVTQWYYSEPMKTATTSLCSIPYPAGTSTLEYAAWDITTGTTTAATIDLATSTTKYSTTTNLVSATSVASGAQGSIIYNPPSGANVAVGGNQTQLYVNVMTAGAGLGGYTYGGTCYAVFDSF